MFRIRNSSKSVQRRHKQRAHRDPRPFQFDQLEPRRLLAVLFADSFEQGEWNGQWVEDSQNDWFRSTQRANDGSFAAEVDGRSTDATLTMANPIDLTNYGSAELSFSWFIESNWDGGEYIAMDVYDGSNWNEVAVLSGNVDPENQWVQETVTIDGGYLVDDFNIRFRANVSNNKEDGHVDNVLIEGTPAGPILPSISIDDVQSVEGDSGMTGIVFKVTRTGDVTGTSSVEFSTVNGSAVSGTDYVSASGSVQFLANEMSKTIMVQVNGDTKIEPDETFTVDLSNPTNATIADAQGLGTIIDDDGPNDPLFGDQWSLNNVGQTGGTIDADIDAVEAWNITTGSLSTVVAIIDNGVDYTHEDFYLNIWLNESEIPSVIRGNLVDTDADGIITFYDINDPANGSWTSDFNATGYIDAGDLLADPVWENGIDDDANGFIDDLIGWDFENDDNDPFDPAFGHGTKMPGTIGASANNGVGVAGINWRVRMMPIVWQTQGGDRGVDELNYAVAQGATISNNAYGNGFVYSQAMYDAIEAAGVLGHLFIAAAGNNDTDNDLTPFYPASYDLNNIIAVTSTDHNNMQGNNYGVMSVDVAAPSAGITTTGTNSTYITTGVPKTSDATPHVTGVAALLQSLYPNATGSQIRDLIFGSVDLLPSLAGITVTGGRVNAATALLITTIGSDDVSVVEGDTGTTQLVFDVRWSGDTSQPVTVDWSTGDGTATAGLDYVAGSGQFVFDNPTLNTRTITIDVFGDTTSEFDESMFINLSITSGSVVVVKNQIVGTIESDDAPPMPTTIFSDSFENGQWNGLWVEDSQNDWFTSTQRSTDGSYSAEVDGNASDATLTVANPIDLSIYTNADLTFDWLIERGFDGGEYLALDFFDGSSWNEIIRLDGNVDPENTWHSETVQLDPQYLNNDFQFRFRAKANKSNEDANIDNVELTGSSGALRGEVASTGADVVELDVRHATSMASWAETLWRGDDAGTRLDYELRIDDLPGNLLGLTGGNVITIDTDAAGMGWFIDATPWENSEFVGFGSVTSNRYDLLTVLAHEFGHLLGHDHADHGVMSAALNPGERLLPGGSHGRSILAGHAFDRGMLNTSAFANTNHHRVEISEVPVLETSSTVVPNLSNSAIGVQDHVRSKNELMDRWFAGVSITPDDLPDEHEISDSVFDDWDQH